jgi:hypothetical protein
VGRWDVSRPSKRRPASDHAQAPPVYHVILWGPDSHGGRRWDWDWDRDAEQADGVVGRQVVTSTMGRGWRRCLVRSIVIDRAERGIDADMPRRG